ncbi:MAG TPA: hypothetical protein VIB79_12050 [Candidatus Binatia bacterium]|jgi:hypothetical protein
MNAFNCKLVSTFSVDRVYRVFSGSEGIFFIQIGGQNVGELAAVHFGLLGRLVYSVIEKRLREKRDLKIQQLDLVHPSAHLGSGKHNFHVVSSEIELSTLEPRSRYRAHGSHAGRWLLKLRGRKQMKFEFETIDEMQRAYDLLPAAIAAHKNKVVWNTAKNMFTAVP